MIYFDYNATAPIRAEVAALLTERLAAATLHPGNPSSVHRGGREARSRLDDARSRVAKVLGCELKEVCFTGSGSEADALALRGAFQSRPDKRRRHIVSSTIEHPAILGTLTQLEAAGATVTRVAPEPDGRVALEAILRALTPEVALCSLMWANNETGVLQPVQQVAQACRQRGILFHTDAVQAAGKVSVTLRDADADLLSISAHKFGAPAGVGALVVRRGVQVEALSPGHQENGHRGGTHNVLFIEALALALELAQRELSANHARMASLRDRFERQVVDQIPDVRVNGAAPRLPNTTNLQFVGADGEALLIALDLAGICVSSGAACASGSLTPSHVLTAMGLSAPEAQSSLRFSIGPGTSEADTDRVVEALQRLVPRARAPVVR